MVKVIQSTQKNTLSTLNEIYIHAHTTHTHTQNTHTLTNIHVHTILNFKAATPMMQFKIHSHINIKPTIKVFPFVSHLYNLVFETSIYFVTLYTLFIFLEQFCVLHCPNKKRFVPFTKLSLHNSLHNIIYIVQWYTFLKIHQLCYFFFMAGTQAKSDTYANIILRVSINSFQFQFLQLLSRNFGTISHLSSATKSQNK